MDINQKISQPLDLENLDKITKNLTYTKGFFGGRHIRVMSKETEGEYTSHTSVNKLLNAFEATLNNILENADEAFSEVAISDRLKNVPDESEKKKLENIALNILTVHHNAKGGLFAGKDKPLAKELTAYFNGTYGLNETMLKNLEVSIDNKINDKYPEKARKASIDLFVELANSRIENPIEVIGLLSIDKQEGFFDKILGDIINKNSEIKDLKEYLEGVLQGQINTSNTGIRVLNLFNRFFSRSNKLAFSDLKQESIGKAVEFLEDLYKNIKNQRNANHTDIKSNVAQIISGLEKKDSSSTSSYGSTYTGSASFDTDSGYELSSESTKDTSSSNIHGPMVGITGQSPGDIAVSLNKSDNSSNRTFEKDSSTDDWSIDSYEYPSTSESNQYSKDRSNSVAGESSQSTEEDIYGIFDFIESSNEDSVKADAQSLEESSSYEEIIPLNTPEIQQVEKEETEEVYQDPGVQRAENTQKPIKAKVEEETDYSGISRIFKGNIERQKDTSETDFSLLGKMFKTDEEEEIAPEPEITTRIIDSEDCLKNIEDFYKDYLEAQEDFLSSLNKNLSTPEARKKALQDGEFDENYRTQNKNMFDKFLKRDFKITFESKYEEGFLPCLKFINQEDVKVLMPPSARQKMIAMFLLKKALNPNIYHTVDYKSTSLLFNEVPLNDRSLNKDDIIHFMYACLSLDTNRSITDGINIPKKDGDKDIMINELKNEVNQMLNDPNFELSDKYKAPISEFINA